MLRKVIVAALGASAGALVLPAAAAFADSSTQHMHSNGSAAGTPIDLGPNASGLPSNCPFPNDDANLVLIDGNSVSHGTMNANGDWGGGTTEGTATFYENDGTTNTPWYTGHLTTWDGGGNNAKSQNEGGDTLTFHGTGAAGTLDIHANFHSTFNAAGTPTANVLNVKITCS
jgi:hypothetical protein